MKGYSKRRDNKGLKKIEKNYINGIGIDNVIGYEITREEIKIIPIQILTGCVNNSVTSSELLVTSNGSLMSGSTLTGLNNTGTNLSGGVMTGSSSSSSSVSSLTGDESSSSSSSIGEVLSGNSSSMSGINYTGSNYTGSINTGNINTGGVQNCYATGYEYITGTVTTRIYYHRNHQGSVIALSNGSGNVVANFEYDDFGPRRVGVLNFSLFR